MASNIAQAAHSDGQYSKLNIQKRKKNAHKWIDIVLVKDRFVKKEKVEKPQTWIRLPTTSDALNDISAD